MDEKEVSTNLPESTDKVELAIKGADSAENESNISSKTSSEAASLENTTDTTEEKENTCVSEKSNSTDDSQEYDRKSSGDSELNSRTDQSINMEIGKSESHLQIISVSSELCANEDSEPKLLEESDEKIEENVDRGLFGENIEEIQEGICPKQKETETTETFSELKNKDQISVVDKLEHINKENIALDELMCIDMDNTRIDESVDKANITLDEIKVKNTEMELDESEDKIKDNVPSDKSEDKEKKIIQSDDSEENMLDKSEKNEENITSDESKDKDDENPLMEIETQDGKDNEEIESESGLGASVSDHLISPMVIESETDSFVETLGSQPPESEDASNRSEKSNEETQIQENGGDETLDMPSVFLTEVKPDDIQDDSSKNDNEVSLESDDHSCDRDITQENPVFVHVNSKNDKTISNLDSENVGNDGDEVSLVEEDPIGVQENCEKTDLDFEESDILDKEQMKDDFTETIVSDKTNIVEIVSNKDADEEICIIPDTERVISQEEKDAATAAAAATTEKEDDNQTDKQDESKRLNDTETLQEGTNQIIIASITDKNDEIDSEFSKVVVIPNDKAVEIPCHQCGLLKKCSKMIEMAKEKIYFCTSICLDAYKELTKTQNKKLEGVITVKDINRTLMDKPTLIQSLSTESSSKVFVRRCAECTVPIALEDDKTLSWETMEFCTEDCLSKYQNKIGSHCANCKKAVVMSSLGKYCVRFGYDIRQFCCSLCLEEFKKGLKVCSYCQKDISGGSEGFLAPVGDKGQFKDFCSQLCMERYDHMSNSNPTKPLSLPTDISQCSVCKSEKLIVVLYEHREKKHKFCSEPCFVAFKFVNHVDPSQCDMCKKYFETSKPTEFSIFYEQVVRNFCCKTCQNIYIIANRRIVPCSWCKVKKYNFDMIKKLCNSNQVLMMCSLNCLSLFQMSINAVTKSTLSYRIKCDACTKMSQVQYHLTMSDSSVRNFCTYHCVINFQNQYSKHIIPMSEKQQLVSAASPVPLGIPRRSYQQSRQTRSMSSENVNDVGLPVITNVQSLANQTNGPTTGINRTANTVKINSQQNNVPPPPPIIQIKHQVIIKKAPPPPMRNLAVMCKPILHTKGVNCRPQMFNKETQTDVVKEKTILVPVPVPIYIPSPLHMFSAPVPIPVPFPLPVPIPIFIPTTRNSAAGIMKEIKKIQVKIPTDPFEAELLMMAEMVAGEKKVDNTDSESDDDDNDNAASSAADGGFSPEAVDTSNTFGDDMLQMALKMATELDEPAVDLEGALTANTITAIQTQDNPEEPVDDSQPMSIHNVLDRQALRGRKRTVRQPRSLNPSKRGRRINSNVELPILPAPQPTQPAEPVEKPDANMCLKYTFGVNAWKQWVTTKNAELEKSSRRVKLFKPEILQLTSDELNYSLCLFVKEVRKPNGTEYAPDTIYYLCLGIQQYLFENGRIDNIFTDAYYEKFTDCLDEVARKFSILYNDSHYIVTRVEEEHLWESKQLGAHSPHVLLSTLMFFNTKHFNLTTVDEHMQLSFSHIMKHWKRNPNQPGAAKVAGSRNVLLRFYPPQQALDSNSRKKKVYEQQENEENPLRCPVKLYEFYLSKCPESVKTRNDVFYLLPERSCVPDSPVWYSTMALGREALEKMLHRVKMVKEINVALLTS